MFFLCHIFETYNNMGVRGGVFDWGTALQAERSRIRFPMLSLAFFIYLILPVALGHWGPLSLYQKLAPGVYLLE
jgi:hypothetical protein